MVWIGIMRNLRWAPVLLLPLVLAACGGDGSSSAPPPSASLDEQVMALAQAQQQMVDPSGGLQAVTPAQDAKVKLGQLLFFSKTLGGTFDSACASCHHPYFAGGDALSLPVGVAAVNPDYVGPGRLINSANDFDPLHDGLPNVPRNSQTIINAALYHSSLFFDGRVQLLGTATDGSPLIRTPDSGIGADPAAGDSLLGAQARFPVTSPDEMRNFFHQDLSETEQFRQLLVDRLKGLADTDSISAQGPANWLARFQAAYGSGTSDSLINFDNIQSALADYMKSMVFVDTPWRQYLAGDSSAISDTAKKGAQLFLLAKAQGGLGCSGCHSGSFFTDEKFYNTGMPQIGRGKRADGRDFGRWQVTKQDADKFAFRTPSLLNVGLTAPYGHAGTFQTLDELLRYHANPRSQINNFDFTFSHLVQFATAGNIYPNAPALTQEALDAPNFATELPGRDLSNDEVNELKAFLETLTSKCLASSLTGCLSPWVPSKVEDPDGNMLVQSSSPSAPSGSTPMTPPVVYPTSTVSFTLLPSLAARTTFPEVQGCSTSPVFKANNDGDYFSEDSAGLGLTLPHGFDTATWTYLNGIAFGSVMMAGGVTVGYLNGDCWPDLVYASGSANGVVIYDNNAGSGFSLSDVMPSTAQIGALYTGVGIADLQGDYRHELVLGNLLSGFVQVLKPDDSGQYWRIAEMPTTRNTFGMAFGDFNGDGYPDIYLGHWDPGGLPGTAPAFWLNNGGSSISPIDSQAGVATANGFSPGWQFSPSFVDADGDGRQDLLIAADYGSSLVLRNDGTSVLKNVTDRNVITDENGMGSALGDYRNTGALDWFVSAIYDPTQILNVNWGVHGNHLYRNDSTPGQIAFSDVSIQAGIQKGYWGWGSCAADFNNDGWLDIFQADGWGYTPPLAGLTPDQQALVDSFTVLTQMFNTKPPRLFINNGDGTFTEKAVDWHADVPMNGRGLACFDYDRDGDVDVAVVDHSKGIKFFENHSGSGSGHGFLSVRLVGLPPNTDALGAKVYLTADLDGNGVIDSNETQMRVVMANSNFNSQTPLDLHFGLGMAATVTTLRIVWPDGSSASYSNLPIDQFLVYHQ